MRIKYYQNEKVSIDLFKYLCFCYRQFGFFAYALDMIKVPSVISRFLIKNYNIHNIPIGSNDVINHVHTLPNDIGIFFAGNSIHLSCKYSYSYYFSLFYNCIELYSCFLGNDQVIIKSSLYTGEKITRQSQISNETQFLLFSVNLNLINLLNNK